jgi:hypothetical protein
MKYSNPYLATNNSGRWEFRGVPLGQFCCPHIVDEHRALLPTHGEEFPGRVEAEHGDVLIDRFKGKSHEMNSPDFGSCEKKVNEYNMDILPEHVGDQSAWYIHGTEMLFFF